MGITGKETQDILYNILQKDELTKKDLEILVTWYGEASELEKSLKKRKEEIKKRFIEEARNPKGNFQQVNDNVAEFEASSFRCVISKKGGTRIGMPPTKVAAFLKRIGKLHLFDVLFKVGITDLKKYVDIHTLEEEGVLVPIPDEEKTNVCSVKRI